MKHSEFKIGEIFYCNGHRWLCADIGSRVITAIWLDTEKTPDWFHGPPYAVDEAVFDENDMPGCRLTSQTENDAVQS